MKTLSQLFFLACTGTFLVGCANTQFETIGTSVLSSTGYVDSKQASGLFSAGRKLAKSQESLTAEQEYYLGRAVSARVLADFSPLLDPTKTKYLNEIGMTLASVSDMPETFGGYHFVVIKSPTINAMSAPGGFIYVSSGFINALPDEDALAAVLAHEIAHIVRQDGVNAVSNASLLSALSEASVQGASIAMSNSSTPVELGMLTDALSGSVEGVMEKLLTKGFDRSQEYRADLYAAQLLQRAGYDPKALVRVLKVLESKTSSDTAGWFATHPDPVDRIESLEDDFTFPTVDVVSDVRANRFRKTFAR